MFLRADSSPPTCGTLAGGGQKAVTWTPGVRALSDPMSGGALGTFSVRSFPFPKTRGQYFPAFSSPDILRLLATRELRMQSISSTCLLLMMASQPWQGTGFLLVTHAHAHTHRLFVFTKTTFKNKEDLDPCGLDTLEVHLLPPHRVTG